MSGPWPLPFCFLQPVLLLECLELSLLSDYFFLETSQPWTESKLHLPKQKHLLFLKGTQLAFCRSNRRVICISKYLCKYERFFIHLVLKITNIGRAYTYIYTSIHINIHIPDSRIIINVVNYILDLRKFQSTLMIYASLNKLPFKMIDRIMYPMYMVAKMSLYLLLFYHNQPECKKMKIK